MSRLDWPAIVVERRCTKTAPCVEVTARLIAADVAQYVIGSPEHADELRARARMWADVHGHGTQPSENLS